MRYIIFLSIISIIFLTGCTHENNSTNNVDLNAFAQCITKAGTKMYGTETCPHCQNQKAMFGESFQYVNYIDCIKTPNACENIDRVPTWEFKDGTREVGEKTLQELSQKTKCKLSE